MVKYRDPTVLENPGKEWPWEVLENHWLGSLKILEGEKYSVSFI